MHLTNLITLKTDQILRVLLFAITFLVSGTILLAQIPNRIYNLDIDEDLKTSFSGNFYIEEVIDNRSDTTSIGIIKLGNYNVRYLAKLGQNTISSLKTISNQLIESDSSAIAVVLRLNDLIIREETRALDEKASVYVNMDFLQKRDDNYYFLDNYSATVHNQNFSLDVTAKHGLRIVKAIKICLQDFWSDLDFGIIQPDLINLKKKGSFEDNHHNVTAPTFFISYIDFFNGFQYNEENYHIEKYTGRDYSEKFLIRDGNNQHVKHYAYYDGEEYYINTYLYSDNEHFIKTYKIDEFLVLNDKIINRDFLAIGKTGEPAGEERATHLFSIPDNTFYTITLKKMKTLLKDDYRDLYKLFRRRAGKDPKLIYEIVTTIFENASDKELIRKILKN